jgi:Nucleotidyl transferase of unknown function (DUF2204)
LPEGPDVSSATSKLLSILREGRFEYAFIGGLAVVLHGYNRYTRDVDALVWNLDERLDELVQLLQGQGFNLATPDQTTIARSARILHVRAEDGTQVDIFLGYLPFEREAIEQAVTMSLGIGEGRVVSAEDLIIMKLIASRRRDVEDAARLIEIYPDLDFSRIRRIVLEYAEALQNPDIQANLDALIK